MIKAKIILLCVEAIAGIVLPVITGAPLWVAILIITIVMGITLLWPSKKAAEQEDISIIQKLFSFINTGHINQHVSIGNTQRKIPDDFKNQFSLLMKRAAAKVFHIHCNYNGP
jgi:hypothetical protein